ncbi:MAG TPA: FAD-binding oxidoreductase [Chloroflexota bacterium]|nr:FAD-binding oxidoreductase [Chloroflexota bacterium]
MALADFERRCREVLGSAHCRERGALDLEAGPGVLLDPADETQVAAVLRLAEERDLAVVPRGGGTKLEWGNAPQRVDAVLSTARLSQVLEHAWSDLTVTVEAGCTVENLQRRLAQHRQRLAVDVLWPRTATVGGILSANDSGALRLRYGGLRDLVIGATVVLADGTVAKSGGKVVKNVAGYDIPKLVTGAFGTLGVITRATFRLHPLPHETRTLTIGPASAAEIADIAARIRASPLTPSAVQIRLATGAGAEADVLLEGTTEGVGEQEEEISGLCGAIRAAAGPTHAWQARERLWDQNAEGAIQDPAIVKISVLPTDISIVASILGKIEREYSATWRAVIQAHGLGLVAVRAEGSRIVPLLAALRSAVEERGGSLVILRRPPEARGVDAWGAPGDALPLMRAVKAQLDPRGVLSPGRFVGGI